MRKLGRLVDKYLAEISPDQGLGVSRFLAVAASLPDSARECYDGVYRALDIYLEVINTLLCSFSEDSIQKRTVFVILYLKSFSEAKEEKKRFIRDDWGQ